MHSNFQKPDLNAPFAIGTKNYKILKDSLLEENKEAAPLTLLELGTGASTFHLANDLDKVKIFSLESDPRFFSKYNKEIAESGLTEKVTIRHCPVTMQFIHFGLYESYHKRCAANTYFDAIIIDGPTERIYPFGREAALYLFFDLLNCGALIFLDDYHRPSARRAVSNWLTTYGKNALSVEIENDSFIVLRKSNSTYSARPRPPIIRTYTHLGHKYIKKLLKFSLQRITRRKRT